MLKRGLGILFASGLVSVAVLGQGRGGGAEWLTANGDAQRTSWIRSDAAISVQSMSKPGFELQWKSKLDNKPRGSVGLSQGVSANNVTIFVPMSVVTGSSNNVYAIDNDTGYVVWQRQFDVQLPAPTAACPGALPAAATRIVAMTTAPPPAGRGAAGGGGGRGASGYRGGVGEPGQGIPPEFAGRGGGAVPGRAAGAGDPARGGGAGDPARGGGAGAAAGDLARGGGAGDPARGGGAGEPARGGGAADPARGGGAGDPARGGGAGRGGAAATAGIPGAPGGGGAGGGFGRPAGVAYVVTSDGVLHVLGLQSGKDLQKPALFLPANAWWSDPIAVNETMYAATSRNCGGAPNGIWAIDLASEGKPVTSFTTHGGGIVGPLAFTNDGTLIAAIGPGTASQGGYSNAILALDPKTLKVKDWYTSPSAEFVSAPVIFRHNDSDIVAAVTRDGRVLLLDATSLGGPDHSTPLHASRSFASAPGTFAVESLATWQETLPPLPGAAAVGAPPPLPGPRWLLLPVSGRLPSGTWPFVSGVTTNGAIVALKVVDIAGKPSLEPAWVSRDLTAPATPIIVNGVVFALSRGRAAAGADATARPTPAVLHALNGTTGASLWNSGTVMTSYAPGRSFWSSTGQVYVGTLDGTLHAFGFSMERK